MSTWMEVITSGFVLFCFCSKFCIHELCVKTLLHQTKEQA